MVFANEWARIPGGDECEFCWESSIVKDRERQDVEFKETTRLAAGAAHALAGFANSRGGHVFFGITDKRVIKGQDVGDDTIEKLISNLDMHIYPSLPLEHEEIPLTNGKTVIRVWTPGDSRRWWAASSSALRI